MSIGVCPFYYSAQRHTQSLLETDLRKIFGGLTYLLAYSFGEGHWKAPQESYNLVGCTLVRDLKHNVIGSMICVAHRFLGTNYIYSILSTIAFSASLGATSGRQIVLVNDFLKEM